MHPVFLKVWDNKIIMLMLDEALINPPRSALQLDHYFVHFLLCGALVKDIFVIT